MARCPSASFFIGRVKILLVIFCFQVKPPIGIITLLNRDGVGDGQINYVLEHEIKAIEKCFQAAGINQADLKFTYIIVSKRINTRFFR